ncbi:MAG: DUF885 family protein [Planctomycetes bacterium]|nr:DUF885 family protein [Planctomycetota bacterium]
MRVTWRGLLVSAVLVFGVPIVTAADVRIGGTSFDDSVRTFDADRRRIAQAYDLPWSSQRTERLDRLYQDWQLSLRTVDFAALDQSGRVDYLALRERLTYERALLVEERQRLVEMEPLLPFLSAINRLQSARWEAPQVDLPAAALAVGAIPDQVRGIRERLERGQKEKSEAAADALVIAPLLAHRTAAATEEILHTLNRWHDAYNGSLPEFSFWMKVPVDEARAALKDYAKFLREEIAGLKGKPDDPLLGKPVGAAGLTRDLAAEFLPYSIVELLAIGERELAWGEARMREAAREMGLGDDWKAALAKVKEAYVPAGQQDAYITEQANEAIAFVRKHDLVSVPALCEESWRITMVTTEDQRQLPYVAYNGSNILAAYARDDMKTNDKLMSMRGNNRHFTRLTTAHELIPGHHLQAFFAERYRSYRRVFWTPFLVEGWALHWEMELWNRGFARSPEDRIGMLFWRMHRAARIIVTLRFHQGEMTPAQMVEFLVTRVGHETAGATSEVRRYISGGYSTLYQCSYLIGALQLQALQREATANGRMTTKAFNDAVLRCGPLPIELIRAELLGTTLTPTTVPGWRFD